MAQRSDRSIEVNVIKVVARSQLRCFFRESVLWYQLGSLFLCGGKRCRRSAPQIFFFHDGGGKLLVHIRLSR